MSDHRRPVLTRSARIVFVGLALFASTLQAQRAAPDPLADGLGSFWQSVSSGQPFRLEGRIERRQVISCRRWTWNSSGSARWHLT